MSDTKSKNEQILEALIGLLEQMDITVKYDRGNFRGGLVRYRDKNYFYLNRRSEPEHKINTIIAELKQINIPENLLTPQVKQYLSTEVSHT